MTETLVKNRFVLAARSRVALCLVALPGMAFAQSSGGDLSAR
jgi:hypothetical protein